MKKIVILLVTVLIISPVFSQTNNYSNVETTDIEGEKLVAGEGEKKVITSAYGESPEKALENALRNAVEEAVGSLVSSETIIENDEIVKDEVLSYSKGFIKTYKKLSEEKDDGDYKVSVVAIITQKQLIEKLEATGVKVEYQTSGMFAQLQAWDKMKQDEFEIAKKVLSINPDKKFPIAYDFNVSVDNPERNGDYYFINRTISAKPNANFYSIISNTKALLNEIAYEAREYSYSMDLGHPMSSGSTNKTAYSAWVNVQQEVVVKKNGKQKIKKNYKLLDLNFPKFEPNIREGAYDYMQRSRGYNSIHFLGKQEHEPLYALAKKQYEKPITQDDKNRLNDHSLRLDKYPYTFDIFEKNYTPYLFIIKESDKITIYKFLNPATNKVVGRYLSYLLEALHFTTKFSMNGEEDIDLFLPIHHLIMYAFDSRIRTTTDNINVNYKGYVLETTPHAASFNLKSKLSAEQFQKITNIAVEPSYTGYTIYETKNE